MEALEGTEAAHYGIKALKPLTPNSKEHRFFNASLQLMTYVAHQDKLSNPFEVPQRLYTLDELKLNGIETLSLLSPVDTTLGSIERNLQIVAIVGGLAAWNAFGISPQQLFYISLGLLFLWTLDAVSFGGGVGSLVVDTIGHNFSQKYHNRHEAGHFLIAYLVGILPKGYTLSSLDALKKEGSLNIQAGTAFVDFEFLEEVALKTLIVIHRAMRELDNTVWQEFVNYAKLRGCLIDLSRFRDGSIPNGLDYSAWIRNYGLYLEERLQCFVIVNHDVATYGSQGCKASVYILVLIMIERMWAQQVTISGNLI
ncbi:hypothetical protein SESBI_17516 [Sesbania bispinosa]|nr:hypothetical protein SESBI_17516 [Sesbania bispinosa]